MIYASEQSGGQSIEIEEHNSQTRITVHLRGAGSSQSQSSLFALGNWTAKPTLHRAAEGHVLRVQTEHGARDIAITSSGIRLLDSPPDSPGESEIPLRESSAHPAPMEPMKPMAPMKPMEPMRMGDMEMRPGEMRMGNMRMSLHDPPPQEPQSAPEVLPARADAPVGAEAEVEKSRFCTQCGQKAQAEDRFCGSCGHRLRAAS